MATRRANGAGSIFKRNGWYYYKRIDENGNVFCRSLKTKIKAEAEDAAKDFETGEDLPKKARLAALQEYLKPKESNPTFDEAYEKYLAHPKNAGQSETSKSEDAGVWKVFLRWLHGQDIPGSRMNCKAAHAGAKRLDDITEEIATEFLSGYKASPQSKNKYMRVLKRVWTFNKMSANPWSNFRKFRTDHNKRRAFTKYEIERIISEADGELKTLFLFGAYTGQRMTDCAKYRWEMLSDDASMLTFDPRKTKHSSGIIVQLPLHRKIIDALQKMATKKIGFITPSLAALTRDQLNSLVMEHFAKCGLSESVMNEGYRNRTPIVGFHSFRSTFISWCADAGLPLAFVQSLVGHMSPELTQLYYRADAERARKFIDQL